MSEQIISGGLGVEEEVDVNADSSSRSGFIEPHSIHEVEDEQFGIKDDGGVISELDPGDGRLFPNMCNQYYESIRWLINPEDHRRETPLYIYGQDFCYREVPEYDCNTLVPTAEIELGQPLDVVSLLSSPCRLLRVGAASHHYIEPKTLLRKYVLLVCVFAPVRWVEYDSKFLCQLRIISDQLSEAQNFEMVIVPKIKKHCPAPKAAFDKLISAFHGRLFVSFQDDVARDQICQRLNFRGTLKSILVDSDHKVAQDYVFDIVANYYYPSPKTNTKLKVLSSGWIRRPPLRKNQEKYSPSSLAQLLDLSYGDPTLCLRNLSTTETTTVDDLSHKLVGLYLYQVGDKLKSLLKVYNQCKEKGLDFDIVVICISLFSSLDPLVFRDVAIGVLQKLIPNTPWWVLPYNAATYAALFNLSVGLGKDRMIAVGPGRKFFFDVHGGEVLHCFGIQAYPFNREMIVRKYELGAKAITLDSVLSRGPVNYVVRGSKRVPVADLYDKVVVVYTDFELEYDSNTYKRISNWYNKISEKHSDFEVVFVYYAKPEDNKIENHSSPGMNLLVRPFDLEHSSFLSKHESFFAGENGHGYPIEGWGPDMTLLFGKGGKLCALDALFRFENYGLDAYPYTSGCGDNYIRSDIMRSLGLEFVDFMGSYEFEKPYDIVSLD